MRQLRHLQLIWILLFIELVAGRTVTHHRTVIDSNGNKTTTTWTTTEDNDDAPGAITFHDHNNTPLESRLRHLEPDSEFVQVASNMPTDELIRQTGLLHGMEPDVITELLNTRRPVVRTMTDDEGRTRTTTYELNSDGSISRRTLIKSRPRYFPVQTDISGDFVPPRTTGHRTTVVKTLDTPSFSSSGQAHPNPSSEWEWATGPSKPVDSVPGANHPVGPHFTRTWHTASNNLPDIDTVYERRTKSREEIPIQLPESWDPKKWHTELAPFDGVDSNTPRTVTKTVVDDTGRTITTTYTGGPTRHRPHVNRPGGALTTTPLPSLEDFLKSQYDTTTKKTGSNTSHFSTTTSQKPLSSIPDNNKSVTTFKLEDLPVTHVLQKGEPIDDDFLKNHSTELKPATTVVPSNPHTNVETSVKSFTKTITASSPPTSADLDPGMQEILHKAGINPNDIKNIHGDTITRTRVEPDGKTVTTTYRVRTIPRPIYTDPIGGSELFDLNHSSAGNNEGAESLFPSNYPTNAYPHPNSGRGYFPAFKPTDNTATAATHNPINDFLSKVHVNEDELLSKNGEVKKTIVDDNGRILTATFMLSTVKSDSGEIKSNKLRERNPIK